MGGDEIAYFKIGDSVGVILGEDADKTGVIVAKSSIPDAVEGEVVPGEEPRPKMQVSWWKVKLDETSEEKDFPDDILERIE